MEITEDMIRDGQCEIWQNDECILGAESPQEDIDYFFSHNKDLCARDYYDKEAILYENTIEDTGCRVVFLW